MVVVTRTRHPGDCVWLAGAWCAEAIIGIGIDADEISGCNVLGVDLGADHGEFMDPIEKTPVGSTPAAWRVGLYEPCWRGAVATNLWR